jgi:uncharacterized protein (DUF433 family)
LQGGRYWHFLIFALTCGLQAFVRSVSWKKLKSLDWLFEVTGPISSMAIFERITFDPHIMGGRACIRGMRLPVSVIIGQIARGATTDDVLADYPDLEAADIQQALEYAAWLTQEEVVPR